MLLDFAESGDAGVFAISIHGPYRVLGIRVLLDMSD
jgi:hypothetical protein